MVSLNETFHIPKPGYSSENAKCLVLKGFVSESDRDTADSKRYYWENTVKIYPEPFLSLPESIF